MAYSLEGSGEKPATGDLSRFPPSSKSYHQERKVVITGRDRNHLSYMQSLAREDDREDATR